MRVHHITENDDSSDIAEIIARRTRDQAISAHRAVRQSERDAGLFTSPWLCDDWKTDITPGPFEPNDTSLAVYAETPNGFEHVPGTGFGF